MCGRGWRMFVPDGGRVSLSIGIGKLKMLLKTCQKRIKTGHFIADSRRLCIETSGVATAASVGFEITLPWALFTFDSFRRFPEVAF